MTNDEAVERLIDLIKLCEDKVGTSINPIWEKSIEPLNRAIAIMRRWKKLEIHIENQQRILDEILLTQEQHKDTAFYEVLFGRKCALTEIEMSMSKIKREKKSSRNG